ncbi:MAG TPA: aldehyde-activating protein [Parvularcula sp.]|nr:aldehyde-activating protein [Parvularcula sp.]HBS31273.1 aldehyde-activating protein [Parvularcula sp.]HBS34940.1 aldehyde-activating protein [Parvularcula sp.]
MRGWRLPWNAACLCGEVKMTVTAPPVLSAACHCRDCQKLTGGAYSLTLMLPETGFAVVSGAPVIGGLHRAELQHRFCPRCHNWLYTSGAVLPGFVNFRPTLLEDRSWIVPYFETKTAERMPGATTGAKIAYDHWPPPDDFGKLLEGYARDGARPA